MLGRWDFESVYLDIGEWGEFLSCQCITQQMGKGDLHHLLLFVLVL